MRGFIEVPVIVLRCKILNNTIQIVAKHSLNSSVLSPFRTDTLTQSIHPAVDHIIAAVMQLSYHLFSDDSSKKVIYVRN